MTEIIDGGTVYSTYGLFDGGTAFSNFDVVEDSYQGELLKDGDFELDGYLTGERLGVYLRDIDLGSVGFRDQDSPVPNGDALMFGRDTLAGPEWGLAFSANHGRDQQAARSAIGKLAAAWNGAASRATPGAVSVLRYRLAGETRRVYGRPRAFSMDPALLFIMGLGRASGKFQTDSPLHYADTAQQLTLQMAVPSGSVITWPGVWPLVFSQGSDRQGVIQDVGGDAPTPVTATIRGPVTNPFVEGDGWRIDLNTTLAYDQTVTVDARARTALRNDGASLAGSLRRTTYLDACRLAPGPAEIRFGGIDPTGTARCDIQWRPAFYGF